MADIVQVLLQRKAEMAKMKAKFSLTEADATLITARSTDVVFLDQEVIHKEGVEMSSVYRIKSGKVSVSYRGHKIQDIGQGWFIGDHLLLSKKSSKKIPTTLTANGTTFLLKLDLEHIRNLFAVDAALSMKFYRYLATKFAAIFFQMFVNYEQALAHDPVFEPYEATGLSFLDQRVWNKNKNTSILYKQYKLAGMRTLLLKSNKINITSTTFGATTKVRVPFEEIGSVTQLDNDKILLAYRKKKITLCFKNPADLSEFFGIVSGLLPKFSSSATKYPISAATSNQEIDDEEEFQLSKSDHELFSTIHVEEHYKKRDKIFEEGDLMQRVYSFTSGTVNVIQNGSILGQVEVGDIIGVASLLILRPSVLTLEVSSDFASALVIPGYKIIVLGKNFVCAIFFPFVGLNFR